MSTVTFTDEEILLLHQAVEGFSFVSFLMRDEAAPASPRLRALKSLEEKIRREITPEVTQRLEKVLKQWRES